MPLYLCRWTNGDCSFVFAGSKREAIELLDGVGNAEGCPAAIQGNPGGRKRSWQTISSLRQRRLRSRAKSDGTHFGTPTPLS